MSKINKKIDKQLSLPLDFSDSTSERAGSYRLKDSIREALQVSLRNCELSREEISDEMTRLTGDRISVHHINNWVADCKKCEWRFPLEYAAAVVIITKNYSVVQAALLGTGLTVADEEGIKLMEFGRIMIEEKRNRKKKQALLSDLEDKL